MKTAVLLYLASPLLTRTVSQDWDVRCWAGDWGCLFCLDNIYTSTRAAWRDRICAKHILEMKVDTV